MADVYDARKLVFNNRIERSPHLVAKYINMIVSPTIADIIKVLKTLPQTVDVGTFGEPTHLYSVVQQLNITIAAYISQFTGGVPSLADHLGRDSSLVNILLRLKEIQIFYFIVDVTDNTPKVTIYSIPVSDIYAHTPSDRAALITSDDDASLWLASGLHVYFTASAVTWFHENDGSNEHGTAQQDICRWVSFNNMVCIFETMTDAFKWTETFNIAQPPHEAFTEIRVDASTAMLAYSKYPIKLLEIHRTVTIDQNSGFKYVQNTDNPRIWDTISKARPYLGDKVRYVVMHVAPGIGIQMPNAILVANDIFACIEACLFDAGLTNISTPTRDGVLTTRLSTLLAAIYRRDASQMRDTGYRMQKTYSDAVTDALLHLNTFLRTYADELQIKHDPKRARS